MTLASICADINRNLQSVICDCRPARMPGRVCLWAIVCLWVLAGCGAVADGARAEALRRWQARPIEHYTLSTREYIAGHECLQLVEIRAEQVVKIERLTCQIASIWTVGWLFRSAEKARQGVDTCALAVPGTGCVCRVLTDAQIEYDPALGYPRSITVRQAWGAAWQRPSYWAYLARYWELPSCTAPAQAPSWVLLVTDLRPLP